MKKHRKNLLNGGIFQMKKKAYPVAFDYMDAYLKTNRNPKDTIIPRVSYWATICAYNAKNPVNTRRYIDAAIAWADSAQKPVLQEYKARTYVWQNDEKNWLKELNTGVKRYPEHDYFFLNLLDWYNTHHQYEQGLALADSLLDVHHEKPLFWYAKSLLSLGKEDYQHCIQFSDSCIIRDKNYADAYYNKGLSFCNLALIAQQDACNDLKDPKCIEDRRVIQSLYQSARPCMEKVRQLQPENSARWASPLYRIYLNLNMGKEFDEIDAVLKKMK
jgi:tetratricopeptide (TPR) repeat protein